MAATGETSVKDMPLGTDTYRVFLSIKEQRELLFLLQCRQLLSFPELTHLEDDPQWDAGEQDEICR